MDDKLLSQEEIDALLKGQPGSANQKLEDIEVDALGEIGNISMGTAATTLSMLLGQEVKITTPRVSVTTEEELRREYPYPYVLLEVRFVQGLEGSNLLVVQEKDALLISELMMGGAGQPNAEKLDEMRLSAVGEAMNQMMGSAATAISTVFQKKVNISPPDVHYVNLAESNLDLGSQTDYLVKISFRMTIGSLADTEIMQILPLDFARHMVSTLMGSLSQSEAAGKEAAEPAAVPAPEPAAAVAAPPQREAPPAREAPRPGQAPAAEGKTVRPVNFAPLVAAQPEEAGGNLGLLLDIPLEVTVELGRTKRLIKEVLELGVGSVIELEKLAGEPVDVRVNGKLVARGEVVVIDENFGVRITEIITPAERVKQLQ
ncbi:MAG: flagellar motor switch protein FliN [Bacillota bacterium]|nr:flagellar motor switch protein FliN [Bacillota bacterium]